MDTTDDPAELMPLRRHLRGPTKRSIDAMETKNKLFEIAIRLFCKYGYESVTIDDITGHAGVSKGTFYTHFDSKDAVLVEQFRKIDDAYTRAFLNAGEMSAKEMLILLVKTMGDYCSNVCGVQIMKIVYMNQISPGDHPVLLEVHDRPFYNILGKIVEKGKSSGEFPRSVDNGEFVMLLSRAARSLVYDWCLYDGKFDLTAACVRQFTLICNMLKAD